MGMVRVTLIHILGLPNKECWIPVPCPLQSLDIQPISPALRVPGRRFQTNGGEEGSLVADYRRVDLLGLILQCMDA